MALDQQKKSFFNISLEMKRLGSTPVVRFIEIVQEDVRYRVSPRHDLSLEGNLDRRLASFLHAHLAQISQPRMVLHEPQACITLPYVTLSNLQSLVSLNEAGANLVMIRFSQISGNPQSVLRASVEGVAALIQDVAISAYEHVFQSGLALTEATNATASSPEDRPELHLGRKRLEKNIDTLLCNLELLKRHVSRADAGQVIGPSTNTEHNTQRVLTNG